MTKLSLGCPMKGDFDRNMDFVAYTHKYRVYISLGPVGASAPMVFSKFLGKDTIQERPLLERARYISSH